MKIVRTSVEMLKGRSEECRTRWTITRDYHIYYKKNQVNGLHAEETKVVEESEGIPWTEQNIFRRVNLFSGLSQEFCLGLGF